MLHAGAALAYHGDGKDLPATYFYPRAHAVAHGTDAYGGLDYEYPPATLPLLVAPLAAGGDDSGQAYHQRTIWLYGALDVVCVAAAGLPAAPAGRRSSSRSRSGSTASACSCSAGSPSRASTSRPVSRSCWRAAARAARAARAPGSGVAGALKLVPLAAAPALTRRGTSVRAARRRGGRARSPRRSRTSSGAGSSGLSWIGYHAGRDPEIESWAARARRRRARRSGAHAGTAFDHGSQNVTGATARWLGRIFALASIGARAAAGAARAPRRRRPRARAAGGARRARGARAGALAAVPAVARAALGAARPALPAAGRRCWRSPAC